MKNGDLSEKSKNAEEPIEHSLKDENVSEADFQENLGKMILDSSFNKYDIILLARRWAYELKSKDEQHRSIQELIAQAIEDVLSGHVTPKTIQELPPLDIAKKQKGLGNSILDYLRKSSTTPKTVDHSNQMN